MKSKENNPIQVYKTRLKFKNGADGFIKNEVKATKCFKKAAKLGYVEAMFKLGIVYVNSQETKKQKQGHCLI